MTPDEIILKFISIPIEGIEKDLLKVIWQVELKELSTGSEIEVL